MKTKVITHDHRKIHSKFYQMKPGPVTISNMPKLQYVAQDMNTAYRMDWAGRPEPIHERWIVWKIVNQLKNMTKTQFDYKFTLMPHEIIWHKFCNDKWITTQVMQVPEIITQEMFKEAQKNVAKNLKGEYTFSTKLITVKPVLCAQKLHVGNYCDTHLTLQEVIEYAEEQGFKVKENHREIYLTPAMKCHDPASWKTVVSVELE